ncbi:MAG: metal ABC transporter permease [Chlorobi bacterium]|nr:metal ABC transporter permease [Chlorobiota bacterium]
MAPAFVECLILVGIHSYLGLHVIRRKVIFVDLALAQIAALGTTVGFLFGIMPGSTGAYWFSLIFTFIGAAVFSISRIRNDKIPQEAVIGLAYAIAASVSILVIDKAPHGAEHIKEILTGSILWVKWSTIRNAAIVYSLIGVFHFVFRKRFILISENPAKAYAEGMSVRFWDFLFYVSFGIVITHSVGTAGVLLVFVFLVVPAIASMLVFDVLWKQLVFGWTMGVTVSVIGLYISYVADIPSGPTVVTLYGAMLTLIAITLYIFRAKSRKSALVKVAGGLGVALLIVFGISIMGDLFKSSAVENGHNHAEEVVNQSAQTETLNFAAMTESEIISFLSKKNNVGDVKKYFSETDDDYTKFLIASRAIELNKKTGAKLLLKILRKSELPFVNEEVYNKLKTFSGKEFGYDASNENNDKAFNKINSWIETLKD